MNMAVHAVSHERAPHGVSLSVKAVLFSLVVVVGVGAGYAYRQHHRFKHVAVHDEGKVYRSGWVDPEAMTELIERHNIRTVINLCTPGEMGEHHWDLEREAVQNAGARLLEIPMPTTYDPSQFTLQPHLDAIANADNYPILVHCQNGIGRTSQFVALYDMQNRGLSADDSLASQPTFGRQDHSESVKAFCHLFEEGHGQGFHGETAISSMAKPLN